jgi:hypothetical protein
MRRSVVKGDPRNGLGFMLMNVIALAIVDHVADVAVRDRRDDRQSGVADKRPPAASAHMTTGSVKECGRGTLKWTI